MTWETKPLSQLGVWRGGGTPSKSRPDFWEGDIPWLSPKDMGPSVLTDTQDHISRAAVAESSTRLVPAGSVALVTRSGILEHTLPSALVPFDVTLNQDMKALTPIPNVDPRWALWGLRAFERQILDTCRKAGTTVASIEWKRLANFQFPVPDLVEQRRIVELVEEHLSHLDAADAALYESSAKLEALRVARLTAAYGNVHRCESQQLADVLAAGRKIAYGVLVPGPDAPGGVPLVRVGDLNGDLSPNSLKRIAPEISSRFPRTLLQGNEVLLSVVGTIGRVVVAPIELAGCNVARAVAVLPFNREVEPHFAAGFLQLPTTKRMLEGAAHEVARKTLNLEDVRQVRIPLPPMSSQTEIAAQVSELADQGARMSGALEQSAQRSRALRHGILTAAFSGRLTGHGSDTEVVEELAEPR